MLGSFMISFRNPFFFDNGLIQLKNNELVLEKKAFGNDDESYTMRVYFEKKPLTLRAIEIIINEDSLKLSIYNHAFNEEYDDDFFKLINPNFFN